MSEHSQDLSTQIPLPHPTALSRPHWDGCKEGVLKVQRCDDCGAFTFIPQPICGECHSGKLTWMNSSGKGKVYSYTIIYRAPQPEFETPYVVAIIELDEGWHMLSNVIECEPEKVQVGMAVEVIFQEKSDEITLPMFVPIA